MGFRDRNGEAFRLGQAQNVFDAGTGDLAAAETLRDNYASANPTWLSYYNSNQDRYIQLRYVESGQRVSRWYNYDGSNWLFNESVEGIPGLPGSGTDFSSLPDYSIPLIGPGPDKIPQPSGINRTGNGEGAYEFEETAAFPQESIQIGFSGILSALGAVPLFRSFVTGRRGTFPFTYYDSSTGTNRTVEISAAGSEDVVVQPDTDTELTTGGTVLLTTTAAEIIHALTMSPKTGSEPTDLRLRFTVQGQTEPFYYWPSKTKWDNNQGGTVPENGILNIENAPVFLLGISDPNSPITVQVEYEFTNGVLLGNATTPAVTVSRNVVTLRSIARLSELDPLFTSVSRNRGYLVLTSKDGSEQSVSTASYDRVYRNLGQGATGGSLSINLAESAWVDCHPDCRNVSRMYLPNYANVNSDEEFVIDCSRVTAPLTFETEITDSIFPDGSTSIEIQPGHVLVAWSHLENSAQPKGPTNRLVIYYYQVPAMGNSQPSQTNTVYLNPTAGFDGAGTNGDNRSRPYQLIGDAFTRAGQLPGGSHKQIVVDEEVTFSEIDNNASGGYNVANVAFVAPACTVNGFKSVGHSFRLEARRLDLAGATDTCIISHNDDVDVDVISGVSGRKIEFDTTTIGHANLKSRTFGTDIVLDFSNLAAMVAGSVLRIEIDRYEGNIDTALNTIPDVAVFIEGWIGNRRLMSDTNGKVWSQTIDTDGALRTTGHNSP